ncbi:ChpI protein, partial [Leptospira sp. 96542]|nr:ChpI protein [Leptospira sp. 96542]
MKTAISIPDDLFVSAENTAKKLGIPRSRLFAIAIEEFIQNHAKENITEILNKVYSKSSNNTDNLISNNSV